MLDETDTMASCLDCHHTFVIKQGEKDWYLERGWSMPVRCRDCRAAKKARQELHPRVENR